MRTLPPQPDLPTPLVIRRATTGDRDPLERLWLIFRHDMSAYSRALPNPDGTYRSERLLRGLSDPSWRAWILTAADRPVGFALVRGLDQRPERGQRVSAETVAIPAACGGDQLRSCCPNGGAEACRQGCRPHV